MEHKNKPEQGSLCADQSRTVPTHLRLVPVDAHARPSRTAPDISFDRHELSIILSLYGRMVAAGEWRDYAIDFNKQKAVFSIYRRSSEVPLYKIEKDPKLARRQGAYSVIAAGGLVLKRGADLSRVIAVLEKPVRLVSR
jgi:hypothetical protein